MTNILDDYTKDAEIPLLVSFQRMMDICRIPNLILSGYGMHVYVASVSTEQGGGLQDQSTCAAVCRVC